MLEYKIIRTRKERQNKTTESTTFGANWALKIGEGYWQGQNMAATYGEGFLEEIYLPILCLTWFRMKERNSNSLLRSNSS